MRPILYISGPYSPGYGRSTEDNIETARAWSLEIVRERTREMERDRQVQQMIDRCEAYEGEMSAARAVIGKALASLEILRAEMVENR